MEARVAIPVAKAVSSYEHLQSSLCFSLEANPLCSWTLFLEVDLFLCFYISYSISELRCDPVLSNSTVSVNSFCSQVWDTCENVSIPDSPFSPSLKGHPDGSNRAFFSSQEGMIWLATIPEQGSSETIGIDESSPFVDLTDQVYFNTEFGMKGMAFHPNFAQNGGFFSSFNCDEVKWAGCTGRCARNSDVNCDPSFNRIPFSCARNSPIQCTAVSGNPLPSLGYIFLVGDARTLRIH